MAKRTPPAPFPAFPQAAPPDMRATLVDAYNRLKADYEQPAYADVHPVKTALYGLAAMGLPGLMGMGVLSRDKRHKERMQDITNWEAAYKAAIENQNALNTDAGPRNYLEARQTQQDAIRKSKYDENGNPIGLPLGTPDLYPRSLEPVTDEFGNVVAGDPNGGNNRAPYMRPEDTDKLFQSAVGASDTSAMLKMAPQVASRAANVFTPPATQGDNPTLQASASVQDIQLPPVIGDPKTFQDNLRQVFTQGLAEGEKKYEFDQKAPDREAALKKDMELAAYYARLGEKAKFEAKLAEIHAKYGEQKTRAEIARINRTGGSGQRGSSKNPVHDAQATLNFLRTGKKGFLQMDIDKDGNPYLRPPQQGEANYEAYQALDRKERELIGRTAGVNTGAVPQVVPQAPPPQPRPQKGVVINGIRI